MNYIIAAIFGIVQGVTEFLPISSSGHLVILHKFFTLPIENELVFDIVLHFSTFLAIAYFFRKEIFLLAKSWLGSLVGIKSEFSRIGWLIILGTIPAGVFGWLFEDLVETKLRSILVVAFMLIIVGVLFIVFEKISSFSKEYKDLKWPQVLLIGFAQAMALVPGVSRSGITIIAGLKTGLKREEAVKFSFLLSLPIVFGAAIKKTPQLFNFNVGGEEIGILLVAFIFSYVSGVFAIKYLLYFAKRYKLNVFAFYRFGLAFVLLVLYFLGMK